MMHKGYYDHERRKRMDQIKIGGFIAEERKRKGYTQKILSEKLGISDKTISKWERGNGFPEVSLLIPLCSELDITVNELLSGERVSEEQYRKKAEENMVNLVKEAQENKKKIILSVMVGILTILAAVPLFMVAGMFDMRTGVRITFIVIGIVVMIIGIAVACIMDREAGAFECPECHERFIPDMKSYIMGAHTLTKRKLTCPKCGAHRYCKKVLTK
jgi:transcriptional regulator with XRE-family HTH domain